MCVMISNLQVPNHPTPPTRGVRVTCGNVAHLRSEGVLRLRFTCVRPFNKVRTAYEWLVAIKDLVHSM